MNEGMNEYKLKEQEMKKEGVIITEWRGSARGQYSILLAQIASIIRGGLATMKKILMSFLRRPLNILHSPGTP